MLERHLFSFFLLVLPDSTDSSRRREWMQWLSFSTFPCEKELNTTVGWLLSLSHKYTIWAFLSFRFLLLWFIVAPRYHCWQWFACGYTFLIHTVWHTKRLSVTGFLFTNIIYNLFCWKDRTCFQLPFTFLCSVQ